ncbi:hypothetical protein C8R44DRAFT_749948 [Mycena epipterygia]|nr:hypothetical protein C8R44DRAFT_749948 [Mycena epipterygia]
MSAIGRTIQSPRESAQLLIMAAFLPKSNRLEYRQMGVLPIADIFDFDYTSCTPSVEIQWIRVPPNGRLRSGFQCQAHRRRAGPAKSIPSRVDTVLDAYYGVPAVQPCQATPSSGELNIEITVSLQRVLWSLERVSRPTTAAYERQAKLCLTIPGSELNTKFLD